MIATVTKVMSDVTSDSRPAAAMQVRDPLRRRMLERALASVAGLQADPLLADVLLLDLRPGEKLPPEAAAFDGALLVLSDDAALAADHAIAGVLPAAASDRQVAAAVAALAEGLVVRTPHLPEIPGFAPREPQARALLTPREVEVLALVGQGQSNKAIARRLNISAHTVKYHLEAIFSKLGVRSRAEAVTRGLRLGVQVL
jgi:two-component system, NarL family, nitrate/nitrite response regulator NarL